MKFPAFIKNPVVIIWVVSVILFIAILFLLLPDIEKTIQAELVFVLASITLYYAILTRKLVKQNREDFEDKRRERLAAYAEAKMQEFFIPFSYGLISFREKIEAMNWRDHLDQAKAADDCFTKDIVSLMHKYTYLAPKETAGLLTTFDLFWRAVNGLKQDEEEKFYREKEEMLRTLETVSNNIKKAIRKYEDKINAIYHTFEPADRERVAEIMSLHHRARKKAENR